MVDNINNTPIKQIEFTHIFKSFNKGKNKKYILDNAQICLKQGECILLSGKNGSGKSTLMRILAGLIKADSATVMLNNEILQRKQASQFVRKHLMYLYQEPYMFDGSVACNLGHALNKKNPEKIKQALQWADLEHRESIQAKCLSGGEKQRLALAQAWLKQPSVLLLDEPTANMDKHAKKRTGKLLSEFKAAGVTLFIATHDLDHLLPIMDRRLILQKGKLLQLNNNETG